ncbi:MAG: flagellin [Bacillus subtilis]|nr:flagellin [Bacillus subtilis]
MKECQPVSGLTALADDAAGLTISESLRSQARGSQAAKSNAQNGMNLLQTAEGDLSIIQDNLQRIRDLTVQAANGTNGTAERAAIQSEVEQRTKEITRLANSSAFNATKLLNGANTTITLQIGPNFDSTAVSLNSLTIGSPLGRADATALGINDASDSTFLSSFFATSANAASFISKIDTAIATVSSRRSTIGSLQNRLESTIESLAIKFENLSASESRIRDVDVAHESASFTKNQILQQASTSLLAQANQAPSIALSLI